MTRRRRWPDGAETQRQNAIAAIRSARDLTEYLRTLSEVDVRILRGVLADILVELSDAERYLVLARLGEPEPE